MKRFIRTAILGLFLSVQLVSAQSSAQSSTMSNFRRNFAVVAFAGIGGAVLGLSTLSFYGTPQDHVENITTGFLLGLAGGLFYVASGSTQNSPKVSSDSYSLIDNPRKAIMKTANLIRIPLFAAEF